MRKRMIKFFGLSLLMLGSAYATGESISAATTTTVDGVVWSYVLVDGEATNVYAKSGNTEDLVIPETLNTYPVVSVGGGTQDTPIANDAVTFTLPSTVEKINDYAFYNDSVLTGNAANGLVIEDNIKSIGTSAFEGCSSLEDINICNYTGTIGESAFEDCTGIEELYVGEVEELGAYAFKGCTSLTSLEVDYAELTTQFQECYQLQNIVFDENVMSVGADTFLVTTCGEVLEQVNSGTAQKYGLTLSNDVQNAGTGLCAASSALVNKTDYQTNCSCGETRTWYFKNPNTTLEQGSVAIVQGEIKAYEGKDDEGATHSGSYTALTYSCNSIFFPRLEANVYKINQGTSQYITLNFGLYSATASGYSKEYYNCTSGYAQNVIYVACTGNTGDSCPENLESSYSNTIFSSLATQCLQIYNLDNTTEVPSYVPEVRKVSINAEYNGTVTEGTDLSTSQIKVINNFSDGTSEAVSFDESVMSVSYGTVVVGDNTISLTYEDYTCTFNVVGIEKEIESIAASFVVNNAGSNYDSSRNAFLVGSSFTLDMFEVYVRYNNGTSQQVSDFSLSSYQIVEGENAIRIIYGGVYTIVTVNGYSQEQSTSNGANSNYSNSTTTINNTNSDTSNTTESTVTETNTSDNNKENAINIATATATTTVKDITPNTTLSNNSSTTTKEMANKTTNKDSSKKTTSVSQTVKTSGAIKSVSSVSDSNNVSSNGGSTSYVEYKFPEEEESNDITSLDDLEDDTSSNDELSQNENDEENGTEVIYESIESGNYSDDTETQIPVDEDVKKSSNTEGKNTFNPLFVVILVIILIGVIGFILYRRRSNNENDEEDDENISVDESEFVDEDEE